LLEVVISVQYVHLHLTLEGQPARERV